MEVYLRRLSIGLAIGSIATILARWSSPEIPAMLAAGALLGSAVGRWREGSLLLLPGASIER